MCGRMMIAGTCSGCGKTTVTTAVLSALKKRGLPLFACKCGPDYIDPMFHRGALGLPSENLDLFFSTPEELRCRIAGKQEALVLMEGVMGYYDGIGTEGKASSYDIAKETETPVILVVNARGMMTSAGALLKGFQSFRPDSRIRGVIFNGVSEGAYRMLARIAEEEGLRPLGYLPMKKELSVAERHLGLITAEEVSNLKERIEKLGDLAEENVDLDGILEIAKEAPGLRADRENQIKQDTAVHRAEESCQDIHAKEQGTDSPSAAERNADETTIGREADGTVTRRELRIGVARDAAFCFCYEENLQMLRGLGAKLCFFSPCRDAALPDGIGGLYLPGGYPELHARELSENKRLRAQIRDAVRGGLPTIAECGGFLYLQEEIDGWPMAGALPGASAKKNALQRFGYATLTTKNDCLIGRAGESMRVHEFHYYDSTQNGSDFTAVKAGNGSVYECGIATDTLYAGFPHLYFPACAEGVRRFLKRSCGYAERYGSDSSNYSETACSPTDAVAAADGGGS